MGHGRLKYKGDESSSRYSSRYDRQYSSDGWRPKRSKRRRTDNSEVKADATRANSDRFTPEPEFLDEPITPPRAGYKRTHYTIEREADFAPQPASSKYENDADFQERLFDVMAEDERPEDDLYYIPDRWRTTAAQSQNSQGATITSIQLPQGHELEGLTDEQYAEHMRNGMWRKSHQEALRAMEEREKAKKQRDREARERREKARREEAERMRQLKKEKDDKANAKREAERDSYRSKWAALQSKQPDVTLQSTDIPWPIFASAGTVSKSAISSFLFDGLQPDDKLRKQTLRAAVLAYHPDRFSRHILRVGNDQRQSVKEMDLTVSQILNELLNEV